MADDWMTDEHKAAALEGWLANPVALAYEHTRRAATEQGRWRPGDRYTFDGTTWTLLGPVHGDPAQHFVMDYAYVVDWRVHGDNDQDINVTTKFLAGAVGVERVTAVGQGLWVWLRERVAANRRVAEANADDLWPGTTLRTVADNKTHYAWQPHDVSPARIAHILRFDPRAVLALCEAQERVLARHRHPDPGSDEERWMPSECCAGCPFSEEEGPAVDDLDECPELRDMAIGFQHHPGYQERWRS